MTISPHDMKTFRVLLENNIQGSNVNVTSQAPQQTRGVLAQNHTAAQPYDLSQTASVEQPQPVQQAQASQEQVLPEVKVVAPQLSGNMQTHFDKLTQALAKASTPQDIIKFLNNPNVLKVLDTYSAMFKKANPNGSAPQPQQAPQQAPQAQVQGNEVKVSSKAPAQSRGVLAQNPQASNPYEQNPEFKQSMDNATKVLEQYAKQ